MYNITLRQVKNGWIVNVSKAITSQGPSNSFEDMMKNVAGSIVKSQEEDSVLSNIANSSNNLGERVFITYKEAIGFITVLEDDMN